MRIEMRKREEKRKRMRREKGRSLENQIFQKGEGLELRNVHIEYFLDSGQFNKEICVSGRFSRTPPLFYNFITIP